MNNQDFDYQAFFELTSILLKSQNELAKRRMFFFKAAINHQTFKVFKTPEKQIPCGYVLWANVSDESVKYLARTDASLRFPHEWNEGDNTLIMDIVFLSSWRKLNVCQLRKFLKTKKNLVYRDRYGEMREFVRKGWMV